MARGPQTVRYAECVCHSWQLITCIMQYYFFRLLPSSVNVTCLGRYTDGLRHCRHLFAFFLHLPPPSTTHFASIFRCLSVFPYRIHKLQMKPNPFEEIDFTRTNAKAAMHFRYVVVNTASHLSCLPAGNPYRSVLLYTYGR